MITAPLDKKEKKQLGSIVGTTIVGYAYINEDEGTYILILNDGRKVSFSSSGDDATHTYFGVE